MNSQSRYAMFAVTILTVFALSAFRTVPAYADDNTPPPTETPAVEIPTTEAATEAIPSVEEVYPTEAPIEITPVKETVIELLIQIPDETQLVVINEEGETVPLASEEAAQLVEVVDPMWCPAGVNPGAVTCSIGYVSLSALIADLGDGAGFVPSGNGVIWIQGGADPGAAGTSILINGLTAGFTGIANFSLMLKGGWNGCNPGCVNTVNTANPSVLDQSLSIINWNGDITLSDITFTGVTVGSASHSAALNVQTTKKITLTNVKVEGNSGAGTVNGVYLDNEDADPLVFGNVSITNSKFNDNKNRGLQVFSEGTITLANVLVNGNDAGGAYLNNSTAVTAKAVTITTGTNEFSNNLGGDGLNISSKGAITFKDITANNNGGTGVFADNHLAGTAQVVTLSGTNVFSGNTNNGLVVNSRGVISVSNLVANNNANGWGVTLDNTYATTALSVKLTGKNEFKFNGGGLSVNSNGTITTNNVVATNNSGNDGVRLVNHDNSFVSSVTMTGTNLITGNFNNGLYVMSKGSITLNNVTANDNSNGYGALIQNELSTLPKSVTLTGYGSFSNNLSGGLEIITKGAITLNNITANNNTAGIGVQLDNIASTPALLQNVTIKGTNSFSSNYHSGLEVNTYGAILMNNVTADHNGYGFGPNGFYGYGVSLDNCQRNVSVCDAVSPKSVILTGYGSFSNNISGGLKIITKGAITLNNVTANNNIGNINIVGFGVQLDNTVSTSALPQNVTINGTNSFSGNGGYGLDVNTFGAILINNITANDNEHGSGADLNNSNLSTTPKAVTLTGYGIFNDNSYSGLVIMASGAITANQLEASHSSNGNGISLVNNGIGATGGVTITGWVYVENNYAGLQVDSNGAINIANLNTKGSDLTSNYFGAILDNSTGSGNITLSGTNQIFDNGLSGLVIDTNGSVVLSNMIVSGNGIYGVQIGDDSKPQNVTLTGANYFYNNYLYGLYISTSGAITLSNLDVYGTELYSGVWLENCGYDTTVAGACDPNWFAPKGITITGTNFFVNNTMDGLWAASKGPILISNMTANFNGGNGATLNNQWGVGSAGGITLTGLNIFKENDQTGLVVNSNGAITISNLLADLNKIDGVSLENYSMTGTTGAAVTLTGVNTFTNNGTAATGNGLVVFSDGQITLSNVTAAGNKASGASLDNTHPSPLAVKPGVKLIGVNTFNQNLSYGLSLVTYGAVDLVNLTADLNGSDGLNANTSAKFTLACASLNNNGGNGWDVTAGGIITLKGIFGFGNTSGNVTSSTPVIVRACPVPAPVVIQPIEDEDRAEGGAEDKSDLVYDPYRRE